jgi:TonB family protein
MGDSTTQSNRVTSYIREIEIKERRRRRNVFISIGVLFLVSGVGLMSYYTRSSEKLTRKMAFDELSVEKVTALFTADNTELIVEYPNQPLSPDTIRSIEDYVTMLVANERSAFKFEQVSQFGTQDEFLPVPSDEATKDGREVAPMNPYGFAIEGDRVIGKELLFAIQGYDESVSYTLDLGNGVKKQVGKFTRYSYPRTGNFLINLVATNEHNATSTNSRFITISAEREDIQLASAEGKIALPASSGQQPQTIETVNRPEVESLSTDEIKPIQTEDAPLVATSDLTPEAAPTVVGEASNSPMIMAEKMPEFPGGKEALGIFLRKKIRYPEEALQNKIEGKVYLRFVVEADGRISNPIIVRGIGYGCDQEAIRLANLMPKWTPGQQNGRNVPVYAEFLVNFKYLN